MHLIKSKSVPLTIITILLLCSCESNQEKQERYLKSKQEKQERYLNDVYQKFMAYVNHVNDTLTKRNVSDLIEYKTEIIDPRDNQSYKAIKLKGINKLWVVAPLNFKNNSADEVLESSNSNQEIKFVPVINNYFEKLGIKSGCYYNENYLTKYIPKGLRIYNKLDLELLDNFLRIHHLNNSDLFTSAPPIHYGNTIISYNSLGSNKLGLSFLPISPLYVFAGGSGSNCIDQRSTNKDDSIAIPLADYKEVEVENEDKKVIVLGLIESRDYQGAKSIHDNVPDTYMQTVEQVAYVNVRAKKGNKLDNFISTYDSNKLFDMIQSFFKQNKYDPNFEIRVWQKFNSVYRNSSLNTNEGLTFSIENMQKAGGLTHFFYPIRLVKDLVRSNDIQSQINPNENNIPEAQSLSSNENNSKTEDIPQNTIEKSQKKIDLASFSKEGPNLHSPNDIDSSHSSNTESTPENSLNINFKVVCNKAYFFNKPLPSFNRKAYMLQGDTITGFKVINGFVYTQVFNEDNHKTSKGWILLNCLERFP